MSNNPDEKPVTELFVDMARASAETNRDITRLGHLLVQLDLGNMEEEGLDAVGGIRARFQDADASLKELTDEFETLRSRLEADGLIDSERNRANDEANREGD